jgi:hypothetical protein
MSRIEPLDALRQLLHDLPCALSYPLRGALDSMHQRLATHA